MHERESSVRDRSLGRRAAKRLMQKGLDMTVLALSFWLAYLLRFDFELPARNVANLWAQLPVVVLIQLSALHASGTYRLVWRYVGLTDLPSFFRAGALATVPILALRLAPLAALQPYRVPLSVIFFDTVLAFGAVLALRVARRSFYENRKRALTTGEHPGARKSVILVGAGHAGVLSVRELRSRGDSDIEPVGFVDDDPLKVGSEVAGIRVLGTIGDLPSLARQHNVDHAIITIADADRDAMRRIVEICERIPLKVQQIPGYYELLQGNVSIRRIRDVDFDELLGRDSVHLGDLGLEQFLTAKCVMVSGAGGSIGSELALQIARHRPCCLVLVERSEYALFEVERRLRELWPDLNLVALVADVGDETRMSSILSRCAPEVLVHAAAHKHVPMMEENPGEAIKNNLFATRTLGTLAALWGVESFVLISTDKAVRPQSIMGASKRMAEILLQQLNAKYHTRYVAVRFGNVLGSTGSVIPIFNEQIKKGGPVTVTDARMTRYFMSIPEAAQLVLTAATLGDGGDIFILDMGEPMSIVELAEKLIRLSGFEPYEDIDIVFTGKRPGEKITEELEADDETLAPTGHEKIFVTTQAVVVPHAFEAALRELEELVARDGGSDEIREILDRAIPEARLQAGVDSL